MRVLLSAYACEPGGGSETGKGWGFAEALARHGCEVVVLTCGSHHRERIEAHLATHEVPATLSFAWHDVPGWRGPGYAQARHIRQHYLAWQVTARRTAKRLIAERSFDVIHHLTWTVLRWPSFLGGLGPRFIFGPVGGGEVAPRPLRRDFEAGDRRREWLRDAANLLSRYDPTVRACLRRADAILVTDPATARHVPACWRAKTSVVADIFAPDPPGDVSTPVPRGDGFVVAPAAARPEEGNPDAPAVLFAGRLEYWKGAHLAVGAMAELRKRFPPARLTIAGTGPEEASLREQAARLGLGEAVTFAGQVPHAAMGRLYRSHGVFLFPSLHDSGPHVIGEALAHGLPVVCLDLGGPGVAVDGCCGAVVRTEGLSGPQVQAALAADLARIIGDPSRLQRLRRGALRRAAQFTYRARVADMIERFYAPGLG